MYEILYEIVSQEERMFILGLAIFAIVAVVCGAVSKTITGVARERTRREIAAYIAEGSMSPEQGERLLRAKATKDC